MRILYSLITTKAHEDTHIKWCSDTWLTVQNHLFLSDHEDKFKNIIKVSDDNTYKSNEEKTINGLSYIHCNFLGSYDWFVQCDVDTFIFTKNLERFLSDKDPRVANIYGQMIQCYPQEPTLKYLSGGAGLAISREALHRLYVSEYTPERSYYNDVTIGRICRNSDIGLIDCPLFHSQLPKFYDINDADVNKHISFHYVKSESLFNQFWGKANAIL